MEDKNMKTEPKTLSLEVLRLIVKTSHSKSIL